MSDINLDIRISDENADMFKRCIRKLLDSTFILKDKDEKLYQFISYESNRMDISDYLQAIGFELLVDDKTGVGMLIPSEKDIEAVNLKNSNIIRFTTSQYHLLLILWKTYLEDIGMNEGNFITKGDLIDKIHSYGKEIKSYELNPALKLFKKYNLIYYPENEQGEDVKIQLYPSLQFGWDIAQFLTVAQEYLKDDIEVESNKDNEVEKDSLEGEI